MSASEKVIANFERGRERVSLGAMKMQKTTMKRYPGESAAAGIAKTDAATQTAPTVITEAFTRFEIFSRDIAEAIAELREVIGEFRKERIGRG